jgi:hypothetical protein
MTQWRGFYIKGNLVKVDEEDWPLVESRSWGLNVSSGTHKYIRSNDGAFLLHRLIMKAPENLTVDHINGDTLDNRKENLRLCSIGDNKRAASKRASGVHFDKRKLMWRAEVKRHGLRRQGRYHKNYDDAKAERDELLQKLIEEVG